MCVICFKPAGKEMPSEETIRTMFENNPHGSGFALQGDVDGNGKFVVKYKKGFMKVEDLLNELKKYDNLKDLSVAMHFRIKTSGETDQFTCHPFPLSANYGELRKLEGNGPVLFHNGVFSGLGGIIDPKSSDTQDFVAGVATRYLMKARMPKKIHNAVMGEIIGTCRVLVLYPNKHFPSLRWGEWVEDNGIFYSNSSYKKKEVVYSSGYSSAYSRHYSRYDDDDYSYAYGYDYGDYGKTYARTKKAERKNDYSHEYDRWGCNIAFNAWPNHEDNWIRFDEHRFSTLMKYAILVEEIDAEEMGTAMPLQLVTFAATGNKEWFLDREDRQIFDASAIDDVEERYEVEMYELETGIFADDNYIPFANKDEMMEWMSYAKKISDFVYRYARVDWYVDVVNLEAFTEEGLKQNFKSGQVGHVRHDIMKHGFYNEHKGDATITDLKQQKLIEEVASEDNAK